MDQPQDKIQLEAQNKALRLAKAFESVFGQAARRSSDQSLVLDHLRKSCGRDFPVFQQDKIGNFDPLRAAHIDGAQTQFLIIKRQLALAGSLGGERKAVKVKK